MNPLSEPAQSFQEVRRNLLLVNLVSNRPSTSVYSLMPEFSGSNCINPLSVDSHNEPLLSSEQQKNTFDGIDGNPDWS